MLEERARVCEAGVISADQSNAARGLLGDSVFWTAGLAVRESTLSFELDDHSVLLRKCRMLV